MDRLTPLDLDRANIPVRLRGFDRSVVGNFLSRASKEIEYLLQENRSLLASNETLQHELERLRQNEEAVKEAILLAQRAADDTRANAHKEADLIRFEALKAKSDAVRDAERDVSSVRAEIDRLEQVRRSLRSRLRGTLDECARLIDEDGHPEDEVISLEVRNGVVG